MTQALFFIVKTLTQLVLLVFLLRFWLPWVRTDFRNPLAQGILRMTSPLIVPARRVLPPVGRLDTATIVVTFLLQFVVILLLLALIGRRADAGAIAAVTVLELAIHSLNLFFFAVLIKVVLSWVAPHVYNPVTAMIGALAEPVLRPFRRLIPPLGGLDISPIFTLVLLQAGVIFLQSLKPFPI